MPIDFLAVPVKTGVDDITAVVIILLEGNPKDKSWGAAQKLMNNVDKFLERLRGFKAVIDDGKVRNAMTTPVASDGLGTIGSTHAGHTTQQAA
jgi:hypothetical protein